MKITEEQFESQIRDLAKIYGWLYYHPFLSKWSERGWPDVALCRPPRLILAELKTETGKVSPYQEKWLDALRQCEGVECFLWRPVDIEKIVGILR